MAIATVATRFPFPAREVWNYVSWHGLGRLASADGPFRKVEVDGERAIVGATRRIHLAAGMPVVERLEEIDEGAFTYRYRIVDEGDLPITDYAGYVRVAPGGAEACHLKFECQFTPISVSSEEWTGLWSTMEHAVMEHIQTRLATASAEK